MLCISDGGVWIEVWIKAWMGAWMGSTETTKRSVGAMELLGIIGFSLMLGWYLPMILWFSAYPWYAVEGNDREVNLFVLFLGVLVGYLVIRLLAFRLKRMRPHGWMLVCSLIVALIIPFLFLLSHFSVLIPYPLYLGICFLTGVASSYFIVSLLDICGKIRIHNFLIYTAASFAGGALLFFLCALMPRITQPVVCMIYIIGCAGFLFFINSRSEDNSEKVILKRSEFLNAPIDFEPIIFAYGVVFGVAFVLLINTSSTGILMGVAGIFVGSVILVVAAAIGKKLSMVMLIRIVTVVLVFACLLIPFVTGYPFMFCLCIPVGLWAVFLSANFASLLKLVIIKKVHVFYHISTGLIPKSAGFLVGWVLAAFLVVKQPVMPNVLPLMLGMTFLLVLVSMVFYPQRSQHSEEGEQEGDFIVEPITLSESSSEGLFNLKCEAVAKLYGLSPREMDILLYLARGRNAEYICNKLVISSHTVKSHIYSIYRKTNSHSQQKVMDLVDEYPIKLPQ